MQAKRAVDLAISWLRTATLVFLLVMLGAALLKLVGVTLPLRTVGHVELAYLAGAYWLLTKG